MNGDLELDNDIAAAYRALAERSRGPSRDDVIEECAAWLEKAPLTYAGPDPTGVKNMKFLIVLGLRDLKGDTNG